MYDIAVIGGGASGMLCAIKAKRLNRKLNICILEAMPRIGKKILATGNGRCNITNVFADEMSYNNSEFTRYAIQAYTPKKVLDEFESIGLKCVEESQGRVYPMSNSASTVLDCLRNELEHLGVEIKTDYKVTQVKKEKSCFVLNNTIRSKKILLSTGGKSSPGQGSDGSGYDLLRQLGHKITPQYPALVQLKTAEKTKMLKGIRVKANVSLYCDGKELDKSGGEVLFTDYGLSGIAIMDISRSIYNRKCECILDILPNVNKKEFVKFIGVCKSNNPNNAIENVISGMLPKKMSQYIIQGLRINSQTAVRRIDENETERIFEKIKKLKFTLAETTGFNNAQITAGGADVRQFNSHTMESELVKGLFCAGEILDVDAPCGGFNLQWAWASALLAGENIVTSVRNDSQIINS